MDSRLHDEPSDVVADRGEVQVSGPNGIAMSLTADAAEETGGRLIEAAGEARKQLAKQVRKESGFASDDQRTGGAPVIKHDQDS
ncbi:hypothetical protein KFK14_19240 [Sphingobium phenoxybenzoativorans]|uniref:Uncharacterized protein n=1 Tax=Sphingobium phenoxybenzoativorans TaxID=1592790 RepID=A0A975K5D6_9SPHN|nr:hypothetical protein [Sphingobium phenoxybenzoativorans]QUT05115.1 hypothetical protein KFK14_19240 [Sphingobium phenoxybenzoativorans]